MAHFKESIPSKNQLFMPWLGNYAVQINSFIAGGNAPDGEPYFYRRGINRWNNLVMPAITELQGEWLPVSTRGNHTSGQTAQFTSHKNSFLKTVFRPFNKSYVMYNDIFTVVNRGNIGILPTVSSSRTSAGQTMEQLFAAIIPLSSCWYEIVCKTHTESGKAACPDGKIVQFACRIDDRVAVGQVQPPAPLSVVDCVLQGVSTHALFRKDFGFTNAGKIMYIFFRWFDLSHPEKSGPWSILYTINLA